MKNIQRFNLALSTNEFGISGAYMQPCEHGAYVSIQSHQKEIDRLQRDLDALKAMQKGKIFDELTAQIHPVAHQGVEKLLESVTESIRESDAFKDLLNPKGLKFDASVVREAVESGAIDRMIDLPGSFMRGEHFARGGFISARLDHLYKCGPTPKIADVAIKIDEGKVFLGGALIKEGQIQRALVINKDTATAKDETGAVRVVMKKLSDKESMRTLCVHSMCDFFISGNHYDIDRFQDGKIRIVHDELVSQFGEDDCWIADLIPGFEYHYQIAVDGRVIAKFHFCK